MGPTFYISTAQDFIRTSFSVIFKAFFFAVVIILVFSTCFEINCHDDENETMRPSFLPDSIEMWAKWEAYFVVQLHSHWKEFLSIFAGEGETSGGPMDGLRQKIQRYMHECKNISRSITENYQNPCDVIYGNPISSFKLIYRLVHTVPQIENLLQNSPERFNENFLKFFNTSKKRTTLPTLKDLTDVTLSILRIQHVYHLNSHDLAEGKIADKLTSVPLGAPHCFEIGNLAKLYGYFDLAVEWLELAKEKSQNSSSMDFGRDLTEIRSALDVAKELHDEQRSSRKWYQTSFFNKPTAGILTNGSVTRKKMREILVEKYRGVYEPKFLQLNYFDICTRKTHQSEETKSKLFCWMETKAHPTFLISPQKIEFLARSPDIVQIYNVISERAIVELQIVSKEFLHPRETVVVQTENVEFRTNVVDWIDEDHFPEYFTHISRKIEAITGLQVSAKTSSEKLRITYYTYGGHYDPHVDASKEKDSGPDGNRIATFMYYLSDVDAGGQTAFISAGITANPVKGSAVFWYNLNSDGTQDMQTDHGACPVILGQKWVANKWMKANDQMFTGHRCSLKRSQRFQIPVNGRFLA